MTQWLAAFALTLLVEVPIVVFFMRRLGLADDRPGLGVTLAAAVLVNLTHPVLWWLGPYSLAQLLAAEAAVVAVEGVALWLLLRERQASRLARRASTSADIHARSPRPAPDTGERSLRWASEGHPSKGRTSEATNNLTLSTALLIASLANATSLLVGLIVGPLLRF